MAQEVRPFKPDRSFRHAHDDWHTREFSREQKSGARGFFPAVVKALPATGRILIFGSGQGASSEMARFLAWQRRRHPALTQRMAGTLTLDRRHLTDAQLLALAREFSLSQRDAALSEVG